MWTMARPRSRGFSEAEYSELFEVGPGLFELPARDRRAAENVGLLVLASCFAGETSHK